MKALIVEDDPVSQTVAKKILEKYAEPVCASDGEQAIQAFETALENSKPFDFVLMDIMMPLVSGLDAVAVIRGIEMEHGIPPSQGVKIVMCTALNDANTLYEAHSSGCDDYLNKPLLPKNVKRVLAKIGLLAVRDEFDAEE